MRASCMTGCMCALSVSRKEWNSTCQFSFKKLILKDLEKHKSQNIYTYGTDYYTSIFLCWLLLLEFHTAFSFCLLVEELMYDNAYVAKLVMPPHLAELYSVKLFNVL